MGRQFDLKYCCLFESLGLLLFVTSRLLSGYAFEPNKIN